MTGQFLSLEGKGGESDVSTLSHLVSQGLVRK